MENRHAGFGAMARGALGVLVVVAGGCAGAGREADVAQAPAVTTPYVELMAQPASRPAPPPPTLIEDKEKSTLIYPCQHARPEVLAEAIAGLLTPEGTVQPSAALNRVVVCDKREVVGGVQRVLGELDRPTAQLLVEARVVEVTVDSDLEYELQQLLTIPAGSSVVQTGDVTLKVPGGSPTEGQGANVNILAWQDNGKRLETAIRMLVTRGKAKILSSPNLIVSPGNEGSIITGQEVPVQSATVLSGSVNTTTQFKRVGIKLRVELLQITGDTARLAINPEVSTVTGFTQTTKEGITNPIIAIRNVTSVLSVKDGEVLTVGGLLQTEDRQIVRGVPLLSDIPLVGLLFQSRRNVTSRTQLIFFLKSHILPEGQTDVVRVHRPGAGMGHLDAAGGLVVPPGLGKYPVTAEELTNVPPRAGEK